jgi:hypothetical protein
MPLKRTIIIPAILMLSTAGSILVGTAATLAATQAPAAVVATASSGMHPNYVYDD